MLRIFCLIVLISLSCIFPAWADCVSPAGVESQTRYDFTLHTLHYCNGTDWVESGGAGGGGASAQTTMTCTANNNGAACTTAACPAGYIRSGCSAYSSATGTQPNHAQPNGTNGCTCRQGANGGGVLTCYTYCVQ